MLSTNFFDVVPIDAWSCNEFGRQRKRSAGRCRIDPRSVLTASGTRRLPAPQLLVRLEVRRPAVRERRDRGGATEEEVAQEGNGVGEVDALVTVRVPCGKTPWRGTAEEEPIEREDRVRKIDAAVVVHVAAAEDCWPAELHEVEICTPSAETKLSLNGGGIGTARDDVTAIYGLVDGDGAVVVAAIHGMRPFFLSVLIGLDKVDVFRVIEARQRTRPAGEDVAAVSSLTYGRRDSILPPPRCRSSPSRDLRWSAS